MYKNLRQRRLVISAMLAPFVSSLQPLALARPESSRNGAAEGGLPVALKLPLRVAFVYVSPVGVAGWSYQHDLGRLAMERNLGAKVQTTVVESVQEGADAERVFRDLAARGYHLIFATSFGYMEQALRVSQEYPGVIFEHAGGYRTSPSVNTYNGRFYEGRYLSGLVAGRMTKTGICGYVAGFPIPEVLQGINAFARGMRVANTAARLKVVWLNRWFDPPLERDAASSLLNLGADVLSYHSGSTAVAQVAEDRGAMLLAYQSDLTRIAPNSQLTGVMHEWGQYYTSVCRAVIDGTWRPVPFWGGIREHVVRMAPFSKRVPEQLRFQVAQVERAIAAGRLQPFSGRIVDNEGVVRWERGPMKDDEIARMNFLVEGVDGVIPRK